MSFGGRRALLRCLGRPLAAGSARWPRSEEFDAIVVLGAPLKADGRLTEVLEERVAAGVALWRGGAAPWLVVCGRGRRAGSIEADGMADAIRARGVPDSVVIVERESRTTAENAARVAEILLPRGADRVLIVTQPFHLRRARMWFGRAGLEARGWLIEDSVQFARVRRGLRWVGVEYLALVRDWLGGSWLLRDQG